MSKSIKGTQAEVEMLGGSTSKPINDPTNGSSTKPVRA